MFKFEIGCNWGDFNFNEQGKMQPARGTNDENTLQVSVYKFLKILRLVSVQI